MKKISKMVAMSITSAAFVVAQIGFVTGTAKAAGSGGCSCQTIVADTARIGVVSKISGDVMVSGDTGFETAKAGGVLLANGQIITGIDGRLSGIVGNCSFSVGENSTMELVQTGSQICLRTSTVEIIPATSHLPTIGAGAIPEGAIIVGGIVLLAGVAIGVVVLTGKKKNKGASD